MSEQFIHSEEHLIADDISKYCGEPKRFNLYLGIILRIGKHRAYQIFSELKHRAAEYLYKPPAERPPPIKTVGNGLYGKQKRLNPAEDTRGNTPDKSSLQPDPTKL
jgi:hypothetical protein